MQSIIRQVKYYFYIFAIQQLKPYPFKKINQLQF